MNVKPMIESTILSGDYELDKILSSIDLYHIEGSLTDEERRELIDLAREHAKSQYKEEDITTIILQLHDLDERVKKLEQGGSEPAPKEYPEYQVGKWYYNGDGCTFESKKYDCIAPEGVVCVWSPAEYPTYWQEVK